MNYGFLDIEMSCDGHIDNGHFIDDGRMPFSKREIISVGFIVADDKYNIKNRYYSVVKPMINPVLSDYCKLLTGLSQEQINGGKKCKNAIGDIRDLCSRYSVDYIFTYGNADKDILNLTCQKYRKKFSENVVSIYAVRDKVVDVKPAIIEGIGAKGKRSPGLESVCEQLEIKKKGALHNALDDAMILFKICREIGVQMVDQ